MAEENRGINVIKSWLDLIRETETPGWHSEAYCYCRVSYTAFREITSLREEGFSMAAICRGLERDGLLPENASPNSFRRAFRRELARRDRVAQRLRNEEAAKAKEPAAPASPYPKTAAAKTEKTNTQAGGADADRLKQLTGSSVKTGSGAVKRLPNGEFEF